MVVTVEPGGLVSVDGTVFKHETPTDPDSALARSQVGVPLTFSGTLGAGALVGVDATGEVGILAAAVAAANSSSVTNITHRAPRRRYELPQHVKVLKGEMSGGTRIVFD